jgi:hypothetical protein
MTDLQATFEKAKSLEEGKPKEAIKYYLEIVSSGTFWW